MANFDGIWILKFENIVGNCVCILLKYLVWVTISNVFFFLQECGLHFNFFWMASLDGIWILKFENAIKNWVAFFVEIFGINYNFYFFVQILIQKAPF